MSTLRNLRMKYLLILGVAFALIGCATTKQDWQEAELQGSIIAYTQFLQKHPRAEQASQARQRLTALRADNDWKKAKFMNTVKGYNEFIYKHATSQYIDEARDKLRLRQAERDWQSTQETNTVAAYKEFLENHSSSVQASKATERLAFLQMKRERRLTYQIRRDLKNAKELPRLPLKLYDYAKNIMVEAFSDNSLLTYNGERVSDEGRVYAKIPSKRNEWQPLDNSNFLILQMGDGLYGFQGIDDVKDVIAYSHRRVISVGYIKNLQGYLIIAIPREIIPCDLELKGLLTSRLPLKK